MALSFPNTIKSNASVLALFCIFQIAGVFYYASYFKLNGYLPSPFIYDKSGTFMDLFNTMWWADNGRQYAEWGTIYPPLNFVLLKVIRWAFIGDVFFPSPFTLRIAALSIEVFFVFFYLTAPILILRTNLWKSYSVTEKALLYLAIILSAPMLFALERGNLIIIALVLLSLTLSYPGIVRSASIAFLVNIKPYFVLLLIHYAIKRRWADLLIVIALSGLIFLITGLILNDHFQLLFQNLFSFSHSEHPFSLREVMSMPSSISAFSYVLGSNAFHDSIFFKNIASPDVLVTIIEVTKWGILLMALLTMTYAQKKLSDEEVISILTIAIINLGVWIGGYSMIYYVAIFPILRKMQFGRLYCGILLFIFLPLDAISLLKESTGQQYSYLSDSLVQVSWSLGLGSIVRPILNLILVMALIYEGVIRAKTPVIGDQKIKLEK